MDSYEEYKGGRPPKPAMQRKINRVTTRLDNQEFTLLQEKVRESGLSQADFLRQAINKSRVLPRVTREQMDLYKNLRKDAREIGKNVNSLCATFNYCHRIGIEEKFKVNLQAFKNMIDIYKRLINKI